MATQDETTRRLAPIAEFVTHTTGGLRWHIAPGCEPLFDSVGLRVAEWLKTGAARIVKTGPHCTVYRVILGELDFYLKHYRLFNTRAWLRQLIRPAKARTEFERGLALRARGLPTVTPLGVGETPLVPGDSYLLTRTLPDAAPLGPFLENVLPTLPPTRRIAVRQAIARQLGELLARMHGAGVVHHDLHTGNLLVRLEPDGTPALFIIDVHAVRIGAPLDWGARRANLIVFNRWFALRSNRSDRLRFWQAYVRSWHGPDSTPAERDGLRKRARDLEAATWTSNLAFWRVRDRRCRFNNRYFRRVRGRGVAGYAVRELDPRLLERLLQDPDAPFRDSRTVLLKDSRTSTVAELSVTCEGEVHRFIYKRFRTISWSDPWAALVRPTAARRSWVLGHGLRERGLPTPRPLLMLHRHRHGLARDGYLLTEMVPDAIDLRRCLDRVGELTVAEVRALLRRLIARLAQLTSELHRRQISQRDLKPANILLSKQRCSPSTLRDTEDDLHLWLIDLVGMTRHGALKRSRRVQNLARLHAGFHDHPALTRTDRLRFLRVYLRLGLLGKESWKRWWTEVGEAAEVKVARNRRRGRPLS